MAVEAKALDQLPPKSLLMEKLLDLRYKYELELATAAFTDLRDCSATFQEHFMNAIKAIEHGNMTKMKDSIHEMKEAAGTCPGSEDYLDVHYLQSIVSKRKGRSTLYYMTLLAFSAIHNQKGMMELLINEGASLHLGNSMIGSPLTQVLVHSQHHDRPKNIQHSLFERLLHGVTCDDLNVNIFHSFAVGSGQMVCICSPVELAILIQRIDLVKLMVKAGANPILADSDPSGAAGVIHLLSEYYEFGTNSYISWLLQEHFLSHEIPSFIDKVFEVNIFNEAAMEMFTEVGRHPAHALLTCGHEDIMKRLIQLRGESILSVADSNGKTALQIAAGQGDVESVKILLKLLDDNCDKDDLAQALLAAAHGGHNKVVKSILQKDITLIVEKNSTTQELWKQAVAEQLTCMFEVLRDLDQTVIVAQFDDNENTLGHIAAVTGNAKLFKVIFPLTSLKQHRSAGEQDTEQKTTQLVPLDRFAQQKIDKGQFAALMWENNDGKTPLHLAIENNYTSIIHTLKERVDERESKPCAEQNIEKLAWEKFWEEWGPKLLIHACSFGSVDTVKLLVEDMMCSPNYQVLSSGETPLSCAAEAGKDDIVTYLLSLNGVFIPKNSKHSPLILAATKGYTRSVRILLKKGADVNERSEEDFNCLMKAIERKHRDTVLAILSDARQGLQSLQFCSGSITPFRMLIEHMPDVAEWVLNRCALSSINTNMSVNNPPALNGQDENENDGDEKTQNKESGGKQPNVSNSKVYCLENKFELLEDFQTYKPTPLLPQEDTEMAVFSLVVDSSTSVQEVSEQTSAVIPQPCNTKWGPKEYKTSNHPLKLMVDKGRENLLNHPLVRELLSYKWKRVGIPGLIAYFSCYMLFLIFLTAFALVIPRPGPGSKFCNMMGNMMGNISGPITELGNTTDSMTCEGHLQNQIPEGFLYFAAVILILISLVYLVFEALQIVRRRLQYLMEYENYIQIALFICSLIFVVPTHGHVCWCTPSWKWQVGVFAVFLGWLNCIILIQNWPVWGRPAAMLLNVYLNFAKLVYLPILLILTFAFPFYMTFVEKGPHDDFITPFQSIWKVLLQTSGDIDAGTIFSDPNIVYPVVGYSLFILFIIAMPILFNNFLIGMAVGETEEERRKARLASIKTKVNYIFEMEDSIPFIRKFSFINISTTPIKLDDAIQKEFQDRDSAVIDEIRAKTRTEHMSLNLRRLTHDLAITKDAFTDFKKKVDYDQKQAKEEVNLFREDMLQCQRQAKEALAACQENANKNKDEMLDTLHASVAILKSEMETLKAMIARSSS